VQLEHPQPHVLNRAAQHGQRLVVAGMHGAAAGQPERAAAPPGDQAGHRLVQLRGRTGAAGVRQRPRFSDPLSGQPLAHLAGVGRVGEAAAVETTLVEEGPDRGLQPGRQQMDMSVNYVAVH
jgi:hypothetical protein